MSNQTEVSETITNFLHTICESIASRNYDRFLSVGNEGYVKGITQEQFENVSQQLAPRMVSGYNTVYFGQLKQAQYQIYLWKLSFEDDSDEYCIRMTVDGDRVAGILIT